MGETSKIEWTDATVNFWWGCTKVGPGCDHCYAESFDRRVGGDHWGTGVPRRKINSAAMTMKKLSNRYRHVSYRPKVFIQSMSDLFDLEVPIEWFDEAWSFIKKSSELNIQIVTKRISAVEKRLSQLSSLSHIWPRHTGLMITVVNQDEADRDIPRLLALKNKLGIPWVGLSVEPMLGEIDLTSLPNSTSLGEGQRWLQALAGFVYENSDGSGAPKLDWVICGGESGPHARDNDFEANARNLLAQCLDAKVPFFGKQNVKKKPLPADLMVREWPAAFA